MSNGVQDPPGRISRDELADYLEYVNGQRRDRAEDLAAGALEYARRNRGDATTRPDIPAAVKDCGCGPLEPCKPHLGAGDLQDWEARARAAEAKLAALRVLIGNPGWATPAEVQRKALVIIGGQEVNEVNRTEAS